MSGAGQATAAPPPQAAPDAGEPGRWRKYALAVGFLAPARFLLGVWVVYPTVRTIIRSFFDESGDAFVWFDNYEKLFTTDVLLTAVRNNAIWVAVVPALVTSIGLVFAVLMERIRSSVAFKTAVFMPMAISAFAAGSHLAHRLQPGSRAGAANAAIASVKDAVLLPASCPTRSLRPTLSPAPRRAGSSWRSRSHRATWPSSVSPRSARTRCRRTRSRRSGRNRSRAASRAWCGGTSAGRR